MAARKDPTANGTITFRGNQHEEFPRCADLYGNWLTEITFHKCSILFIPDCIGNCLLLEKISFNGCMEFTHFTPSLGRLSRLRSLFVVDCAVFSGFPDSVEQLTSLRHLQIKKCGRLTCLPESLGNLHELATLYISDCASLVRLPDSILYHNRNEHPFHLASLKIDISINFESILSLPTDFA
jgi:hypothetical protein